MIKTRRFLLLGQNHFLLAILVFSHAFALASYSNEEDQYNNEQIFKYKHDDEQEDDHADDESHDVTSNWHSTTRLLNVSTSGTLHVSYESLEEVTYSPIFIFMCIVYTISTLTAIITNLIVLLVYILGYKSKTELSIFLINLAIADFLMSTFCMPFTFAQALLKRWIFGEIMCPIVLFKQVFTVSMSIYTMVAIGIDRYYAIKSPLKNRATHRKGKLAIIIVWIISISLASVQLFVARMQLVTEEGYINHENDSLAQENRSHGSSSSSQTNDSSSSFLTLNTSLSSTSNSIVNNINNRPLRYACNEKWESFERQQTYTLFNFFAVYLIPVFILGYTYTCIACIIKQTTHPGNADPSRDMNYNKSKNKVVKMLILLVCVFTVCWLPLHMFTLIKDFTNWLDDMPSALWFFYSAHWLAMANCTINPIIYGYSSKNFRSDVYALILCCRCETRREWRRRESSKTTNLFKRIPRSGHRMSYLNNPMAQNANYLRQQQDLVSNPNILLLHSNNPSRNASLKRTSRPGSFQSRNHE